MVGIPGLSDRLAIAAADLNGDIFALDGANQIIAKTFTSSSAGLVPQSDSSHYTTDVLSTEGWIEAPYKNIQQKFIQVIGVPLTISANRVITIPSTPRQVNLYTEFYEVPLVVNVTAPGLSVTLPTMPNTDCEQAMIGKIIYIAYSGTWSGAILVNHPSGNTSVADNLSTYTLSITAANVGNTSGIQRVSVACQYWGGNVWMFI